MKYIIAITLLICCSGCTRGTVGPYVGNARMNEAGELELRRCKTSITAFLWFGIIDEEETCEAPSASKQ